MKHFRALALAFLCFALAAAPTARAASVTGETAAATDTLDLRLNPKRFLRLEGTRP